MQIQQVLNPVSLFLKDIFFWSPNIFYSLYLPVQLLAYCLTNCPNDNTSVSSTVLLKKKKKERKKHKKHKKTTQSTGQNSDSQLGIFL